jgi:glycosyltransferase involved in cell wall biosynthesis
MKVLIDGRVLKHKYITGVERYTKELINAFDKIGFPYEVALPESGNRFFRHLWFHFFLPFKSKKYDILFCPGNISPLFKFPGYKVVSTIHGLACLAFPHTYNRFFVLYYKYVIPKTLKNSDAIIVVSQSEKEQIFRNYPWYKNRIYVIPNGINDFFLSQKIIYEKENYILYVGSLNPVKNVEGIIKAFLMIKDNIPHSLVIAGPKLRIFKKIKTKCHERIKFVDNLAENELINLYKKAAVFVFPSFYEASPFPPFEAMACGCPVVASAIPSLIERCGDAAVYCNPYDIRDISEKILMILKNKKLCDELINKGINRVKNFSWIKIAKETIKVFEDVYYENSIGS